MKITRLSEDHWLEYKNLRLECVVDTPQSFLTTYDETEAEPESEWRDKIQNMFFAVNDDGELMGMVGVYSDPREKLKHIANVVSVYVKPAYRGQGIARQLLNTALDWAKTNPEISKIQLGVITTQEAAYNLYSSVGFQKVGEQKKALRVGETFYDEFVMEIVL